MNSAVTVLAAAGDTSELVITGLNDFKGEALLVIPIAIGIGFLLWGVGKLKKFAQRLAS